MTPASLVAIFLTISVIASFGFTVAARGGSRRPYTDAEAARATILPRFGGPEPVPNPLMSPGVLLRN